MKTNRVADRISKWKQSAGQKRLVLAGLRMATLSLALIELAFDPPESSYLSPAVIAAVAIIYSGFKLVHPLRWYTSPLPRRVLHSADILVSAVLLLAPRLMHTSFALYSLNPVVVSAMLFRPRATVLTAGATAAYYAANFFSFPLADSMQNLSSMFASYVVALGLAAVLPYAVNFDTRRRIESGAISGERLRLGREIHDGVCQAIYGLRLELHLLRREAGHRRRIESRLGHVEALLDVAESEARGSIALLRSFRNGEPLLTQIDRSLKRLGSETGIRCRLEADGEPDIDEVVKLEVVTITEEALRNVARHSGARQVAVRARSVNGHLRVCIADDGRGMAGTGLKEGHGLTVMKERAESVGGNLNVASVPGQGTEIRVEVPRKWFPEIQTARQ